MDIIRSFGMAAGIAVGVIIGLIIIKFANKNKKLKTEYDERQELVRGRGYRYAFYTIAIYETILLCVSIGGFPDIPVEQYVFHAFGIFLGAGVLCAYCIWNDAYWGRNNDLRRFRATFSILLALNVFPVVLSLMTGVEMVNGYLDFPFINLICVIFMAGLGITAIIKKIVSKNAGEEE